MKTWVVVANSTRARFFEVRNRRAPLIERFTLVNPEERLYAREIKSDKPGRGVDRRGGQRHTVQHPVDPKEQEAIRFAREVVARLDAELHQGCFDRLCVVAAPHFLGLMRAQMDATLTRRLVGELDKDLTREDPAPIAAQLGDWIRFERLAGERLAGGRRPGI